MPDDPVVKLMKEAPISFLGTVERLGAATMSDLPIDQRTAIVRVDQVLHAPAAFAQLGGTQITVQLAEKADPPKQGEQFAFFVTGVAFGDSIAVAEIGRLPAADLQPHLAKAQAMGSAPLAELQAEVEAAALRDHVADASLVVVGRVSKLEEVRTRQGEHDQHYWKATIDVHHVEKGRLRGDQVEVLYANSLDVRWRDAPKPKAGQEAVWILHDTDRRTRPLGRYVILHPEDVQPVQHLEALRADGS
jgi:hypothetical protein